MTMEMLLKDGRIHPARIEELVEKTVKRLTIRSVNTVRLLPMRLGTKPSSRLDEDYGSLAIPTSYGQNVLRHSIEVAKLAGIMASELG